MNYCIKKKKRYEQSVILEMFVPQSRNMGEPSASPSSLNPIHRNRGRKLVKNSVDTPPLTSIAPLIVSMHHLSKAIMNV